MVSTDWRAIIKITPKNGKESLQILYVLMFHDNYLKEEKSTTQIFHDINGILKLISAYRRIRVMQAWLVYNQHRRFIEVLLCNPFNRHLSL